MSDEQLAGAAELRLEMAKVNSGSKREAELQQELNGLYQRHAATRQAAIPAAPVDTALPRPDGYAGQPTTDAMAEANIRTERLAQLQAERELFGNTTARNQALDADIESLLRQDFAAQQSYAPEPTPTPDTLEWPEGTPDDIKGAFCALGFEHDIPTTEAQAAVRELTNITPAPADPNTARPILQREFGAALPSVLAHAEQVFGELPPKLQQIIQEPEIFFSPPVLKRLDWLWQRSRRGGR